MIQGQPATRVAEAQRLLASAAAFACDTALAISVVLPREPGLVAQAQAAAQEARVAVTTELRAATICVRFAPRRTARYRLWELAPMRLVADQNYKVNQ